MQKKKTYVRDPILIENRVGMFLIRLWNWNGLQLVVDHFGVPKGKF